MALQLKVYHLHIEDDTLYFEFATWNLREFPIHRPLKEIKKMRMSPLFQSITSIYLVRWTSIHQHMHINFRKTRTS